MPLYCAGLCDAVKIDAGAMALTGGEVHEVRRRQPDVDDVDALAEHAVGERRHQRRTGRAHVPADEQLGRAGDIERRRRRAPAPRPG